MHDARTLLDRQYLTMRERLLSLAADFDRLQRSSGGEELLRDDPRMKDLFAAAALLQPLQQHRAEQLQQLLSDHTPRPS